MCQSCGKSTCGHENELIQVCKECLKFLELAAGRKIGDTRINPFTCDECGADGDGGVNLTMKGHYGSDFDMLFPITRTLCDRCFREHLELRGMFYDLSMDKNLIGEDDV